MTVLYRSCLHSNRTVSSMKLWAHSAKASHYTTKKKYPSVKQKPSVQIFHKETNTTQHTSYFIEHTNLSQKVKTIFTILKCQPRNTTTHVLPIYIPQALNMRTCINHLEQQEGWPISFCGPTHEPVLAKANTGKTSERFWKKCRWMDLENRYELKEEILGSKWSKHD